MREIRLYIAYCVQRARLTCTDLYTGSCLLARDIAKYLSFPLAFARPPRDHLGRLSLLVVFISNLEFGINQNNDP